MVEPGIARNQLLKLCSQQVSSAKLYKHFVERPRAKPMQARYVPLKSEVYPVALGCGIRMPSSLPDTGPGCGVPTHSRAVSTAHYAA
jgi:hypothetical protein